MKIIMKMNLMANDEVTPGTETRKLDIKLS